MSELWSVKRLLLEDIYPNNSVDIKKKDQLFLKLFTKDLQHFSIIEDTGFKEFVKLLHSNYQFQTVIPYQVLIPIKLTWTMLRK